jgi:hypothetical protein
MRHENLAQSNLLQIISQRTHSLQLRSEQYFLSHFDLPELSRDYSFIYGDLVGSVLLNEQYGGSRVGAMVDEHLELLWNKFQNLGIILGREKGDFISVTVPKLASDFGDTESGQRSAQIFRYLNSSEDIFQSIARKHGILLPVSYRFVFACAGKQSLISIQEKASMKAFTYLVDPAIDSAARLLNGFVLPRECIILSNAPEQFFEKNEIVELPAHRIRGKTQEVTIYKLKKNSSFKQSA